MPASPPPAPHPALIIQNSALRTQHSLRALGGPAQCFWQCGQHVFFARIDSTRIAVPLSGRVRRGQAPFRFRTDTHTLLVAKTVPFIPENSANLSCFSQLIGPQWVAKKYLSRGENAENRLRSQCAPSALPTSATRCAASTYDMDSMITVNVKSLYVLPLQTGTSQNLASASQFLASCRRRAHFSA